jgi:hypothetical protein
VNCTIAPLYYLDLPTLQVDQLPFIDHSPTSKPMPHSLNYYSTFIIHDNKLATISLLSVYIEEKYSFSIYFYLLMSHFRYMYQVSKQQSDSDSALKEKWGELFKLNLVSQSSEQHIIMTVTEHT